jgi:hypothetical protein
MYEPCSRFTRSRETARPTPPNARCSCTRSSAPRIPSDGHRRPRLTQSAYSPTERHGAPFRVPFVCHLAAGHSHLGLFAHASRWARAEDSLQSRVFAGRQRARERHGARTPSFAVMRYRPKRIIWNTPICRYFPTGEADAGTRTPDPIITSYERYAHESAWLSQIDHWNQLCAPRVCHFVRHRCKLSRRVSQSVMSSRVGRSFGPLSNPITRRILSPVASRRSTPGWSDADRSPRARPSNGSYPSVRRTAVTKAARGWASSNRCDPPKPESPGFSRRSVFPVAGAVATAIACVRRHSREPCRLTGVVKILRGSRVLGSLRSHRHLIRL